MYKRLLGTAAAFLTSLAIAAGGLYMLRLGLKNEEKSLLSEKGTVEQKSLSGNSANGADDTSVSYLETDTSLSEEELYQVLKNDEEAVAYQPHEPYYGQLTMQQAVEKGRKWLNRFREENSALDIPKEIEKKVWANLIRGGEEELSVMDSNRIFSSWNLNFDEAGITVDLVINAVTGEVLSMDIFRETVKITGEDRKKMLETFVSQFDFPKDGEIQEEGDSLLIQSLCGGRFYVVAEKIYAEVYDEAGEGDYSFRIKITTRRPIP